MTVNKQDSNTVVSSLGEQSALGALATTLYVLEPNTFADTGGTSSLVSRAPIGTRKKQRGTIIGVDAKGGWNSDFTRSNHLRWLRGFFVANYVAQFTTMPMDGAQISITSVAASDQSFNAASGFSFLVNHIVLASGFTNSVNNGLFIVGAGPLGTKIVTTGYAVGQAAIINEASPPAGAKLEVVGYRAASGDLNIDSIGELGSTTLNFTTLGLQVGSWIFVGGDVTNANFALTTNLGYMRIATIAAHLLSPDKTSFTPAVDPGTGKKIEIWFPHRVIQDAATGSEVLRYYSMERQLGNDGVGIQSETLVDMFSNEFTLNVPKKSKINIDLAFLALNCTQRTGTQGLDPTFATRKTSLVGEDAYNTSTDVYRMRVAPVVAGTLNPTPLFGYVSSSNLKVSNGATTNEAVGTKNGFDFNLGDFDVTGTIDAYFTTVAAVQAVNAKTDVTFDMIVASRNAGFYFDIPLIEMDGGMVKVEKNKPVTLPLTTNGVQSLAGYVLQFGYWSYLPTAAMPPS